MLNLQREDDSPRNGKTGQPKLLQRASCSKLSPDIPRPRMRRVKSCNDLKVDSDESFAGEMAAFETLRLDATYCCKLLLSPRRFIRHGVDPGLRHLSDYVVAFFEAARAFDELIWFWSFCDENRQRGRDKIGARRVGSAAMLAAFILSQSLDALWDQTQLERKSAIGPYHDRNRWLVLHYSRMECISMLVQRTEALDKQTSHLRASLASLGLTLHHEEPGRKRVDVGQGGLSNPDAARKSRARKKLSTMVNNFKAESGWGKDNSEMTLGGLRESASSIWRYRFLKWRHDALGERQGSPAELFSKTFEDKENKEARAEAGEELARAGFFQDLKQAASARMSGRVRVARREEEHIVPAYYPSRHLDADLNDLDKARVSLAKWLKFVDQLDGHKRQYCNGQQLVRLKAQSQVLRWERIVALLQGPPAHALAAIESSKSAGSTLVASLAAATDATRDSSSVAATAVDSPVL